MTRPLPSSSRDGPPATAGAAGAVRPSAALVPAGEVALMGEVAARGQVVPTGAGPVKTGRWPTGGRSRPVERTLALAVILIVLALVAGVVAYITVQGQSAVRAYVAGESHWSKSQLEAGFQLYRYGLTGDPAYLLRFNEALEGPLGNRLARLELQKPDYDRAVVNRGFTASGAHPDDLDLLVWSFRCCHWHPDMRKISELWEHGELRVSELQVIARQLEAELYAEHPSVMRLSQLLEEIERINEEVQPIQHQFTDTLGDLARKVSRLLMVFASAMGLLLAGLGTYVIRRGLRSIRESEAQYQTLLQNAGAGLVVITRDCDHVLEVNRRVAELRRRPAADLIGQPFGSLFEPGEGDLGATALERRDEAAVLHRRILGDAGQATEVEVTIRPTNWYGRPARLAVIHDISARLKIERALRVADDAIANMSEAVIITDARFVISSVNRAFSTITGFEAHEVVGRRHLSLIGGLTGGRVRLLLKTLHGSGRWQGELEGRRRDGEAYPRKLSIAAVHDDDGRVTHYVCLFTDHSAFRDYERRLRQLAEVDGLTGLLNRASFAEQGARMLARAQAGSGEVAILYIDLDGFKFINDNYGHGVGDEVLRTVASRIRDSVVGTTLVARIGGDEFNLLLEQQPGADDSQRLAANLVRILADPIACDGRTLSLSASIGMAHFPRDARDLGTLAARADVALYQAKGQGRNNFQIYERDRALPAQARNQLADDLREALDKDQFQLHYQPQVDLATGRIVGFEALLRWQHPELGWVPPALLIPISEEIGVIDVVSDWVLAMACRQGATWRSEGLGEIPISANLSPRSFWDRGLPGRIRDILDRVGWPASALCLEVTEGTLMAGDDPKSAMRRIRDLGVRLSIDDFGVGYSSLTNLRQLPLDYLKIDRSFIAGVPTDRSNVALVRTILSLASGLGLTVVAEGVENEEQRRVLIAEGCPQAQGYLFGRPAPATECARLLRTGRVEIVDEAVTS